MIGKLLTMLGGGSGGSMTANLPDIRSFLEPRWRKLRPREETSPIASEGMSRPTAMFLYMVLNKGGGTDWAIEGGYCAIQWSETIEYEWPRLGEAMDTRTGRRYPNASKTAGQRYWHDGKRMLGQHFWLRSGNMVVDVAGDQYGWPETVHGPFSEAKYKRFDKLSGMGAVLDVRDVAMRWFKEWESR